MSIKENDVMIIIYPKKSIPFRFMHMEELQTNPVYKSKIIGRYKKFPSNIMTTCEPSHMIISVKNEFYSIDVSEGIIWDGVTSPINIGDVVRVSADTLIPTLYHDGLYANNFFDREVCDILFKKLIDYNIQYPEKSFIRKIVKKTSRLALIFFSKYFGGLIYYKINPSELYINNFIKITRLESDDVRRELDKVKL